MKYLVFFLLIPGLLLAQTYRVDQLIDTGLKNNYGLQQSEISYEISQSKLNSSRWNLLPEVSAGFNQTNYFDSTIDDQLNSLTFRVTKKISLNDSYYFQNKYSRYDLDTANMKLDSERRNFVYQVIKAYIGILDKQKQLELQNKNLGIQQSIVDQSKLLLKQKKSTEFDVRQSEITLLNVQIAIKNLQNDIRNSRKLLFNMLNMTDENYTLAEIELPNPDAIGELNSENVTDLLLLKREIERDDISLKQNKLSYLPEISLNYLYNKAKQSNDFSFDSDRTNHTLSLEATYSLWNYFKNGEEHRQTKLNQKVKKLTYESKKMSVQSQYEQYKDQMDYLKEMDNLYQLKKENTQENLNIAEQKYQMGMIQQIELDKARYEFLDASVAYESNRYKLIELNESVNYLLSGKLLNKY